MYEIMICGNLTADPVVSERTIDGRKVKVANFRVAAENYFGEKKVVQFFNVSAWRSLGEVCGLYLTKGRGVLIKGTPKLDSYVRKDGTVSSQIAVLADKVQFLGGKKGEVVILSPDETVDMETGEIVHAQDVDEYPLE